jgi:hypothetical protein
VQTAPSARGGDATALHFPALTRHGASLVNSHIAKLRQQPWRIAGFTPIGKLDSDRAMAKAALTSKPELSAEIRENWEKCTGCKGYAEYSAALAVE